MPSADRLLEVLPTPISAADSAWRRGLALDQAKVLIVGRGPVRLEAVEVFQALGAQPSGILLSERDSVVYPRALAPELRRVGRHDRVHRLPDYAGSDAREKAHRIDAIIAIAKRHGYTHIFAGYGFMAEDHQFIGAIEDAGIGFVGPASRVALQAGAKDAAKALARQIGVSVTPGLDNIVARTLLANIPQGEGAAYLERLVREHRLDLRPDPSSEHGADFTALEPELQAEHVIAAALRQGIELVTLEALQRETERQVAQLLTQYPGRKLRLKHIGGGGGKGQRVISAPRDAPQAVYEVLNESKATGPADNKNFLIELNIENTRHNEIQLLGNGDWSIALGGRDCSLQMHEQKLVEISITQELLEGTAQQYETAGRTAAAAVLWEDLRLLQEMEAQAERFGEAVGLDSASTFESIVFGNEHYFMEMNTRIQVEHRVTEMVYGLRFDNPDQHHPEQPGQAVDGFQINSLVGAMLLVAVHGDQLPRPARIPRFGSGAELRINATNDALQPHAGGIILDWTSPQKDEVRDDQGIGIRNPDTGHFMPYHLAGAYDSNAALVVTHGEDRGDNLLRLLEILRTMELHGHDVMTNQAFLYGLVQWMVGCDAMAKPNTNFVQAYLSVVGALAETAHDVDLDLAWHLLTARATEQGPEATAVLRQKHTLLLRPLRCLFDRPHLLAGWLAPKPEPEWIIEQGRIAWRQNPLATLEQLYHYLRLEARPGASPEERIWDHDQQLLKTGHDFYRDLAERVESDDWPSIQTLLAQDQPPPGFEKQIWERTQAAHRGFQTGLELLNLPLLIGQDAGFYQLSLNERLETVVPEHFLDPEQHRGLVALAPPPPARSNEILAWTGGTFYARPEPEAKPFVVAGQHFKAGDTIGILEVMKMFNPIRVEFSGTVAKVLVADSGVLVHKGQPLFDVEPDVPLIEETEAARSARRREHTRTLLERI